MDSRRAKRPFSVEITHNHDGTSVWVQGDIDRATAGNVAQILWIAACLDHGGPVYVDLVNAAFVDDGGVRAVLDARQRIGDRVTLDPTPTEVQRAADTTTATEPRPFDV